MANPNRHMANPTIKHRPWMIPELRQTTWNIVDPTPESRPSLDPSLRKDCGTLNTESSEKREVVGYLRVERLGQGPPVTPEGCPEPERLRYEKCSPFSQPLQPSKKAQSLSAKYYLQARRLRAYPETHL